MTRTTTQIIAALTACGLGARRAAAQSTEAINPTTRPITEGKLVDALKFGETIGGRIMLPNQAAADPEKPTNKVWMWLNLEVIDWVIIAAVRVTLAVVVISCLRIWRLDIEKGCSGHTITKLNG